MLFDIREKKIIELLEQQGSVTVSFLAEYFGISKVTIRRHIDKIAKDIKTIQRVRGGAISNKIEPTYEPLEIKAKKFIKIKEKIGNMATSLIKEGDTIILDSGSTNQYIAGGLGSFKEITIITNDLEIALIVARFAHLKTIFAGGEIRPYLFSSYGPLTENFFDSLVVDKLFLGVAAIDLDMGITNTEINEATLKQKMINSSKEIIVMADSSKFNKSSLALVTDFSNIDIVISDKKIPKKYINFFKEKDVRLILV
jgi:DeoR/GlpR family transcriptional regulator of sugar metabolism